MIDSKNMDKSATCIQECIVLTKDAIAASQTDIKQKAWRAPYAGKILSIHAHAVAITDADDSARVDVKKATTSVLSATINPTQDTHVAGTLKTDGTATFAAGDVINLHVTTGGSDAITDLAVTIVVRPLAADEASRPNA